MKKTSITIHHTAIYAEDDLGDQFDTVNESHRKRWNGGTKSAMGLYGGYHYIVERNGAVQQFRNDWETGAHNNKGIKRIGAWLYSANSYALGITFAGNMSRQNLTDHQIKSAVELVKELQRKHGIPDENITPHRADKATQCPGNNLPDPVWNYLQEQNDKIMLDIEPDIVKWHKGHKIIEKWSNPPTPDELRLGWALYKFGKAKLKAKDFNL